MVLPYFLIAIAFGVLLATGVAFLLLKKHRIIWNRLWAHEEHIEELRRENIRIRKELCLNSLPPVRMKPMLPSQHGEDLWLWDYFNKKQEGFFVEVGAYDGITFSNTYFLEAIGWSGILIEPNPDNFQKCTNSRPYSTCINAAVSNGTEQVISLSVVAGTAGLDALSYTHPTERHVERVAATDANIVEIDVPTVRLSKLLEEVDEKIDLISIDVEGAEMEVLQSLDFDKHAPEVFIIEDNSLGRDERVENYLRANGYDTKTRCGANILFVKGRPHKVVIGEESPKACAG